MSHELDLSILKSLISNKKIAIEFASGNDAKLFSSEVWTFANAVVNYVKTYKDLPTLKILVEKNAKNSKLVESLTKSWEAVNAVTVNDLEFKHDLEKLKVRYANKQVVALKESLLKADTDSIDTEKVVGDLQKVVNTIKSLNEKKEYERKTLKDAILPFREEYNAKLSDPTFERGIQTGYSVLDQATGGLNGGELVIIGGESSSGKSILLQNLAIQCYLGQNTVDTLDADLKPGNNILYFSLEMPFKPCLNRTLARLAGVPSKKIKAAKLNHEEASKLKKALNFIQRYEPQFEIVDIPRGATMNKLEALYEKAKLTYDPKIVIIDYLGLMASDGEEKEDHLALGAVAAAMHEFSRAHNITVITAVQLNRAKQGKDAEEKIGLHRIGRSALILTHANIAIQIETRKNEKDYPDMIYHLIKNRDGELTKGRLIKNLANGSLFDEFPSDGEGEGDFTMRDVDDISDKMDKIEL